jgi:hypothetical protein
MPTIPHDCEPADPTPLGAWMARSPRVRTGKWVARGLSRSCWRTVYPMEVSRWRRHPDDGGTTPTPRWRRRIEAWTKGAVAFPDWLVKRADAEDAQG